MGAKFCSECGRILREDFLFCPECGVKVGDLLGKAEKFLDVQQALKLFNEQKSEEAFPHLLHYAEQGNADCQTAVGYCYDSGEGVEKDRTKAIYWYEKSAQQGHIAGQYYLGDCYYSGRGVAEDFKKAAFWLEKAAMRGFAEAQFNLGLMYTNGMYFSVDLTKALYWFEQAAKQGHATAQYNAASIYLRPGDNYNWDKGLYWLQQAANSGDESAIAVLKAIQKIGR